MKKLLCLCIVLVMIMAMVFAVPVAADATTLTVTANGINPRVYNVGDEIVFFVGLNAGAKDVLNGQAYVEYDSKLLKAVNFEADFPSDKDDDPCAETYSFAKKIAKSNCVLNLENPGIVRYNFTAANGVGLFQDTEKLYVRFHFKVLAAGTTDISHYIEFMCDTDEGYIYYNGVADSKVKPTFESKTYPALVNVGDIDGNGSIISADSVILARFLANWNGYDAYIPNYDTADFDRKGNVNSVDLVIFKRALAKWNDFVGYVGYKPRLEMFYDGEFKKTK